MHTQVSQMVHCVIDVSPFRASSGKEVRCLAQADELRGSHAFYLVVQKLSSRYWIIQGFVNYFLVPIMLR